jgi:hypothetical protein
MAAVCVYVRLDSVLGMVRKGSERECMVFVGNVAAEASRAVALPGWRRTIIQRTKQRRPYFRHLQVRNCREETDRKELSAGERVLGEAEIVLSIHSS